MGDLDLVDNSEYDRFKSFLLQEHGEFLKDSQTLKMFKENENIIKKLDLYLKLLMSKKCYGMKVLLECKEFILKIKKNLPNTEVKRQILPLENPVAVVDLSSDDETNDSTIECKTIPWKMPRKIQFYKKTQPKVQAVQQNNFAVVANESTRSNVNASNESSRIEAPLNVPVNNSNPMNNVFGFPIIYQQPNIMQPVQFIQPQFPLQQQFPMVYQQNYQQFQNYQQIPMINMQQQQQMPMIQMQNYQQIPAQVPLIHAQQNMNVQISPPIQIQQQQMPTQSIQIQNPQHQQLPQNSSQANLPRGSNLNDPRLFRTQFSQPPPPTSSLAVAGPSHSHRPPVNNSSSANSRESNENYQRNYQNKNTYGKNPAASYYEHRKRKEKEAQLRKQREKEQKNQRKKSSRWSDTNEKSANARNKPSTSRQFQQVNNNNVANEQTDDQAPMNNNSTNKNPQVINNLLNNNSGIKSSEVQNEPSISRKVQQVSNNNVANEQTVDKVPIVNNSTNENPQLINNQQLNNTATDNNERNESSEVQSAEKRTSTTENEPNETAAKRVRFSEHNDNIEDDNQSEATEIVEEENIKKENLSDFDSVHSDNEEANATEGEDDDYQPIKKEDNLNNEQNTETTNVNDEISTEIIKQEGDDNFSNEDDNASVYSGNGSNATEGGGDDYQHNVVIKREPIVKQEPNTEEFNDELVENGINLLKDMCNDPHFLNCLDNAVVNAPKRSFLRVKNIQEMMEVKVDKETIVERWIENHHPGNYSPNYDQPMDSP